jgi:acetylornithine deacetylase/succinyl-diaminopimelate desuccinylase-like protein
MRQNLLALILLFTATPATAQLDLTNLQDEAVQWLQDYLGVNTINPPGNETIGAEFLAAIFESEGIDYEIIESAPGRGNIWARLDGGDEPALLLLHHIDVVPADATYWEADPLSGEIRDGLIYGRGALDTKGLGIIQLAGFVALHRSQAVLDRDVIFMATADEEAGGFFGVGWLVENRPELFDGVGFVLNEGGSGTVTQAGGVSFGIEVTQKVPYWLRLTARGEPGHGSRPFETSSATELVAALERLRLHEFEARVIPAVDAFFKGIAPAQEPPWRERFANISVAVRTPGVLEELHRDLASSHALVRNTCSITRFSGSDKINVIPPEVWAEIDCRLLPDQDPRLFLAELGQVLGDQIEVETLMGFTPAISSADTRLYEVIESVTRKYFPDVVVASSVSTGFTDSHFLRDLGITAYGYSPVAIPLADRGGAHGNNERISVENIQRGVAMMLETLREFATTAETVP